MSMRQLRITKSITNRDSLSFEKYLQEIAKIRLISSEEEIQLAQSIRSGSEEAIVSLTKANLRFVVSVAKQYQFKGLSLLDLINEGNIGLIKAARRFDETKGFKFISYAVWWVRQSIIQAISDQSRIVRLPSNKMNLGKRILKAESQLAQEFERTPSNEELAIHLEITTREVEQINGSSQFHQSLDMPLAEGFDGNLLDLLATDKNDEADTDLMHAKGLTIEIKRCLQCLPAMQRDIISSYFGIGIPEPISLQAIGLKYDLTPERVRQLKEKAVKQLRMPLKTELLKTYL